MISDLHFSDASLTDLIGKYDKLGRKLNRFIQYVETSWQVQNPKPETRNLNLVTCNPKPEPTMAETHYSGSDANSRYQRYRPKWYNPRMSIFWWIRKKPYVHFIVRELTSVFVATYAIILIFQLRALSNGPEAYDALVSFFETPFSLVLHVVILLAVIFHSITWFKLAPTAMVLKLGKKRIPGSLIITANFLMWIVLSVGIAWLIVAV